MIGRVQLDNKFQQLQLPSQLCTLYSWDICLEFKKLYNHGVISEFYPIRFQVQYYIVCYIAQQANEYAKIVSKIVNVCVMNSFLRRKTLGFPDIADFCGLQPAVHSITNVFHSRDRIRSLHVIKRIMVALRLRIDCIATLLL